MATIKVSEDGSALTVLVPMSVRSRGGQKLVLSPVGQNNLPPARTRIDCALVKLLARAHRWRLMLESGRYSSLREIAVAEDIGHSYVGRVMQLTLLSPDIIEAVLGGRQPPTLTSGHLLSSLPAEWAEQQRHLQMSNHGHELRSD
jgi:hypothetical protein